MKIKLNKENAEKLGLKEGQEVRIQEIIDDWTNFVNEIITITQEEGMSCTMLTQTNGPQNKEMMTFLRGKIDIEFSSKQVSFKQNYSYLYITKNMFQGFTRDRDDIKVMCKDNNYYTISFQ